MSKFLDKTGLGTFWAKIKNTFVQLSDKGAAGGVASLDSDSKLPTSQLPVKIFYAFEARTIRVCRVPYFGLSSGGVSAFEMTCRWRAGSAKLFVNLHGNSTNGANTVSIIFNGSLNLNELKFYRVKVTVDETPYFDIYVIVPAYHRCFIAPSVTSSTYADYSVYNANATMPEIGTNTTANETAGKAILIEAKFIAQGVSSSGDAPVKVDASGNLSSVEVDGSPTAGNTTHLVSSDGINTALEGKADRYSAYLLRSSVTNPNYWFTLASIRITSSVRDISGVWDVYLKMRGRYYAKKEYTILAGTLLLEIYSGSNSSATGAPLRKLKFITDTNCPLELVVRRTGTLSTGSVAVEIMAGNLGTLATNSSGTDGVGLFLVERERAYFSNANTWDYSKIPASSTEGDASKPTGYTPATPSSEDPVVVVYSTNDSDSSGNPYHKTYLYDADVESEYKPTSDAPVNGKALAVALAGGVDTAKQVVNNDNNAKYKLDSGGLDVYDEQSGQRNSGTKVGISGVEINSGTTESTTLNSSGLDLLKNGQHVKVSHSGFVGPLTGNVTGNVSGSAGSLDVNDVVGGPTVPVYFKADGTPEACTLALNSDVLQITSEKELSEEELATYTNFLIINNAKVKIYFERLQPGVAYKFYNPQGSYCDLCFARESNMTCYRTWNSSTEQLQTSVFVSPPSLQRTMGMAVVVRVGTKAYVAGY